MSTPPEYAMPGVHAAARQLLDQLPRGTLLDLGAGGGALSHWAAQQGFDTTAVDADESVFEAKSVRFVEGNLNRPLPFADSVADVVVSLEVIEHLENGYAFLREMSRLVRPGGYAVLSTPNESNLHSRLMYFLTGFFSDASYVMRVPEPGDHYYPHVNCLPLPTLEYCWRRAGFELVDFLPSRRRAVACALLPLLAPLQWVKLGTRRSKPLHADAKTVHQVHRLMNDARVLTGRILVFLLHKPARAARKLRAAA